MLNGPAFLVGLTPTKILPTGDTQVDSRTLAASARTASRRACDRLGIARRRQSRRVRSRSIGRFLFTVPNLPTGWPARYRIATPTLICCGTVCLWGHGDCPAQQRKLEFRAVAYYPSRRFGRG